MISSTGVPLGSQNDLKRYTPRRTSDCHSGIGHDQTHALEISMSDSESESLFETVFNEAVSAGDLPKLRETLLTGEFVLLSTSKSEDNEEENVGALTAEIDEFEVLVAFTSEANAESFVREMGELFSEDESVDGVVVEGQAMLDYLPDGYGLLIDPELESTSVLDPKMTAAICQDS